MNAILPFADDDEIDATLRVSGTKLFDRTRRESDPSRYVDTVEAPFVTLPLGRLGAEMGVSLGDSVVAIHPRANTLCYAVVGDSRDAGVVEPSIYLADALGSRGGEEIIYLIFPGSGDGQGSIPTVEQIQSRGDRLDRGGADRPWSTLLAEGFTDLLAEQPPPVDRTLHPARVRRRLTHA